MLGYGTISFTEKSTVQRVLNAAMQKHGLLRVPFATTLVDPEAIACASMADCKRAFRTSPSLRDSVAANAPLAPSTKKEASHDYFFVKVERSESPYPSAMRHKHTKPDSALMRRFDGFAGGWAQRAAEYAREDRKYLKEMRTRRP